MSYETKIEYAVEFYGELLHIDDSIGCIFETGYGEPTLEEVPFDPDCKGVGYTLTGVISAKCVKTENCIVITEGKWTSKIKFNKDGGHSSEAFFEPTSEPFSIEVE